MNHIPNLPIAELIPFIDIEEKGIVLLATSTPAWYTVKDRLRGLNPAAIIEATEATTDHWDSLFLALPHKEYEIVYSVGGGLTADAAKYLAMKLDLPLTVMPTALSVDAFITAASGIRRDGCVYYIPTKVPERLILDFDVIAGAPASIRAAGITDVMSIATGCWDWKFAHEQGLNPEDMQFIPWVYENAQSILHGVLDCAEAAGRGDLEGLKVLYDCLAMEVQLCNQVGHARPEEGSEHYFAYCAENYTGHGWPHGDLVGPGIMVMLQLQGQTIGKYESALRACKIHLDRISAEITTQTLKSLPSYCKKHRLAFGIAHTLQDSLIQPFESHRI